MLEAADPPRVSRRLEGLQSNQRFVSICDHDLFAFQRFANQFGEMRFRLVNCRLRHGVEVS